MKPKKRQTKTKPTSGSLPLTHLDTLLTLPYDLKALTDYYEVVIDQEALEIYLKKYFECYPRRRKKPIEKPFVPSLNKYLIMNKDARNELKQHWEDFMWTIIHQNGWGTLHLKQVHVEVWYCFGDKRRSDIDNRIFR